MIILFEFLFRTHDNFSILKRWFRKRIRSEYFPRQMISQVERAQQTIIYLSRIFQCENKCGRGLNRRKTHQYIIVVHSVSMSAT